MQPGGQILLGFEAAKNESESLRLTSNTVSGRKTSNTVSGRKHNLIMSNSLVKLLPCRFFFILVLQIVLVNSTMGIIIEGPFVEGSGNWTTLVNGSFEGGNISQWQDDQFGRGSFAATSAMAYDGVFSAGASPFSSFNGAGFALTYFVSVTGGQDYVISAFINTGNISSGQVRLDVIVNGNFIGLDPAATNGISEWQFLSDTVSIPSGVNSVTVRLIRDGNVGFNEIAFFDEIGVTSVGSFTAPTVIPEPSVMVLLGMGIFSVFLFKRSRQAGFVSRLRLYIGESGSKSRSEFS